MTLIPAPFLFRYKLPVVRVDKLPRPKAPLITLPKSSAVPFPSALQGQAHHFAKMGLAWNPHGLAIEIHVSGKQKPAYCNPEAVATSDAVLVWIDTRDTQSQHRGSRFCHHFVAMPYGSGDTGLDPVFRQLPVPRAREDAPEADPESLLAEAEMEEGRYRLALWFPRESLHGFEPAPGARLGFYLVVQDSELGRQTLSVTEDFPFEADPSLWASVEFIGG